MLKFTVERKAVEGATALLNQVANLRSAGATPSESSGIRFTPTTLTLSNLNEANGVVIENIPITVVDGDIAQHLDVVYMLNTKKLDSVVRGSGSTVVFTIGEGKVIVGEDRRKYELSMFSVPPKEFPELRLLGYAVTVKDILKHMEDTNYITENTQNIGSLSGSLFSGKTLMASDRLSAIYIKDNQLFSNLPAQSDVLMCTDLFSTCLPKIGETEAMPGFTADGVRFVLCAGNIRLYKTLSNEQFPKDMLVKRLNTIEQSNLVKSEGIKVTVKLDEFISKLKELNSIVESEDYQLIFGTTQITVGNANIKSGAEGQAVVDAQVQFPAGVDPAGSATARFLYTHLELIGRIFRGMPEITMYGSPVVQAGVQTLKYLTVYSAEKAYFITPRAM